MRVLSVTSEIYPLIKTGGLADVAGALPGCLAPMGIQMRTLVPGYPAVKAALQNIETAHIYPVFFGGSAQILSATASGLDLFVLDAPHLYERPGNPYTGPDGKDWADNAIRFAALSRAGADIGKGILPSFKPEIVHVHDWQAGLVPAFLHYEGGAKPVTIVTVHNLAFQGQFDPALLPEIGLPDEAFALDGVEYYGTIGYLKAALQFADRITTVSPAYALEILQPEGGMGLDGLLRQRRAIVSGILNGIDTDVWNPATDVNLAANYDVRNLTKRARNKTALQKRLGLTLDPMRPLFGVVSRLSWQKGLDLLADVLPALTAAGQLALLGSGEKSLEEQYAAAALADPENVACIFKYDEALAHLIQAGADILLVPSRFEPCGLTQLCALHYGAVPLVSRVGGLIDTIIDANEAALATGVATGIQFSPVNAVMIEAGIRRAVGLYQDKNTWTELQKNGMRSDVSWHQPARRYAALYHEALRLPV
ncbi:glycogen synthase 2 [Acidocella aquatica]|uniref:Glycogen synthase n=1 Tax=Acidocella aquatica TaxID=1922313 RepID=A0ABQ6A835_9PROT|nr:glycogen synthase GlgA [Acidocella aquatica]GLR67021.1 glycogen synthase 2 [Acidocella aquatica]